MLNNFKLNFSWEKTSLFLNIIVGSLIIVLAGLFLFGRAYKNKVLPGISLSGVYIGGMEREELVSFLRAMNEKLSNSGVRITLDRGDLKEQFIIYPTIVSDENIVELIKIDAEKETDNFLSFNKKNNFLSDGLSAVFSFVSRPNLSLKNIYFDEEKFIEEAKNKFSKYESPGNNAGVKITELNPLQYEIISSTKGVSFDYENLRGQVIASLSGFVIPEAKLSQTQFVPVINEEDIQPILGRLENFVKNGDFNLKYTDLQTNVNYSWSIPIKELARWIESQKTLDNGIGFGVDKKMALSYLNEKIAPLINKEPRDAKFKMGENGKVSEFQGSRPGIKFDEEENYKLLNQAILQRTWHNEGVVSSISVVIQKVEPAIKTGEVNNLGIEEILGIGYSSFKGSPTNRIKNINFAAKQKLNGMLIKPGEDFSMLAALKPFTIEGGYLPELVIKGDEIKPEVGGGLCQISTTMFRAAMNSGLPILSRAEHALVVSYYNDYRNRMPGTDATIYDPAPDFKFKNDTGNYILIETEVNNKTSEAYFTLWGKSDSRKGSYTVPIVKRWIGYGEPKEIETEDLEPGQKKCQEAHVGAEAYFTYIRELPNGEKIERVFESYYKALPKICMIGVEKKTEELPAEEGLGSEEQQAEQEAVVDVAVE
jgi:vancomycin resistance protein YoaR